MLELCRDLREQKLSYLLALFTSGPEGSLFRDLQVDREEWFQLDVELWVRNELSNHVFLEALRRVEVI